MSADLSRVITAFCAGLKEFQAPNLQHIDDSGLLAELRFNWLEAAERLEAVALSLERNGDDLKIQAESRRILHTVKGDAGLFDLVGISLVIHEGESLLEACLEQGRGPTGLLLALSDWLSAIVAGDRQTAPQRQQSAAPDGLKILMAEDESTSRILLQELLRQFGQLTVTVNGREASAAAIKARKEGAPYDLICLDIMMPEMDGQEALRAIRAQEEGLGILSSRGSVIIMTTSLNDLGHVSRAYQSLCDGYLIKPLDRVKLLTELRKFGFSE